MQSDIHFSDIIDLYCFDRRLRSLIFNTIEKIEVAVRAKIVQTYCESTDSSHWFNDKSLYKDLKRNILSIIGDGGNLLNLQEMGFPKNWKFLDVWK